MKRQFGDWDARGTMLNRPAGLIPQVQLGIADTGVGWGGMEECRAEWEVALRQKRRGNFFVQPVEWVR